MLQRGWRLGRGARWSQQTAEREDRDDANGPEKLPTGVGLSWVSAAMWDLRGRE
jgi:hypothetical protein